MQLLRQLKTKQNNSDRMAVSHLIKILKYYLQKLKTFFLSKDILSFLFFLVLSAGFWFVHALGKERETTITIPVQYIGVPLNIAFTNYPPKEINVSIKDQGLRLFDYSKAKTTALIIDLGRSFEQNGEIHITHNQLTGQISRYLHMQQTTTILEVNPDSILIKYQKMVSKTLPIQLISRIELMNQYMLSGTIKIEPKTVTVFGPHKILDKMTSVPTELITYKNLNDTVFTNCKLKSQKFLRYSSNKTKVSIFVEAFTERKVQIPVSAFNCPPNLSIRTFPAFVTATYRVGLSRFNDFNSSDIEAYLDYKDLKLNKISKQFLKIKNNVSHISNVQITPQEVEFILEQKLY